MSIVVGVDGGATRASAVALDETGGERARIEGPAGIIEAGRIDDVVERLAGIVRSVLASAKAGAPCDAVVLGLAGAGHEPQRSQVEDGLRAAGIGKRVEVVADAEPACYDAFGDGPGILVIAGTGSIAWGRGPQGERVRAGGWGARLGDEGSGFAIALAGLRAVARATDGRGPPTALTRALLLEPGLHDPVSLVRWAENAHKSEIAALGPAVIRLRETDETARRIVDEAVTELALHVSAIVERLGPWDTPRVALAGGLLEPGRPLRDPLRAAIAGRLPGAHVLDEPVDAARGAARMALRRLG